MRNEGGKKLFWFQHLHKAGGTTVVELAKLNGMDLYPSHANGNPLDENGEVLPLWNLSSEELKGFVDQCLLKDVDFVATEWGMPDMETLSGHAGVRTFAIFRSPFERFLSNFNYDSLYSFTEARSPAEYASSGPLFARPNYYTRILSRRFDPGAELSEKDYDRAAATLDLLDLCLVLEMDGPFQCLGRYLGWSRTDAHANKTRYPWRHRLKLLATGNITAATKNLRGRKVMPDPALREWFQERNTMDLRLYSRALAKAAAIQESAV